MALPAVGSLDLHGSARRPVAVSHQRVHQNYEYCRWVNAQWSAVSHFSALNRTALFYDWFQLGYGKYDHVQGYNVAYSDGSVKWYSDSRGLITKKAINMPADCRAPPSWSPTLTDSGLYRRFGAFTNRTCYRFVDRRIYCKM